MISLAVIGTSNITSQFIAGCRISGALHLAAVYSRTIEKGSAFAADFGCERVFTDLFALAQDSDIDAVYIATPNIFHFEQAMLMLTHKKHVICEKPVAVTLDEVKQLIAAAATNGVIFTEAIMERYLPARQALLDALPEIGIVKSAVLDFSQLSSRYGEYLNGGTPNIFNPALAGGALMDLGIYCVYAAVELFGPPESVKAKAKWMRTGCDGGGEALLGYPDKQVKLIYTKEHQGTQPSIITGTDGTIYIDSISKMTGIRIVCGGNDRVISGDMEKPELMSFEGTRFADFIAGHYLDEYTKTHEKMIQAHTLMERLRNEIGLKFK